MNHPIILEIVCGSLMQVIKFFPHCIIVKKIKPNTNVSKTHNHTLNLAERTINDKNANSPPRFMLIQFVMHV